MLQCDGRIRQKLQVREWSRNHTYGQDHTRGWCRMLRFLPNSIGPCNRLSHVDIPLARGFDFMKSSTGCVGASDSQIFALYAWLLLHSLTWRVCMHMLYLARRSSYAAAIFPAPALDATAFGAVNTAVPFVAFVDISILLTVATPQ